MLTETILALKNVISGRDLEVIQPHFPLFTEEETEAQ